MSIAKKSVVLVLSTALLAGGLCACDKSGDTPGQKLDKALDKTGETVKDAGEAIKPR